MFDRLKETDPEIYDAIYKEAIRQHDGLELIASENFVSYAVLEAASAVMTNKYAEGYPGKRYYGGCTHVDEAENLARDRAKQLFGCEHVNVQPHSGSQANMAVYFCVLKPGDTVMGLDLSCGGHLTHGLPLNFSGKFFNVVPYFVDKETEVIDYDAVMKQACEVGPKLIIVGASAYPRTLDFKRFREICDECGALMMVDIAHIAGLIVAGLHPSPIPYADFVTTTTHKTLRGPRGGMIMCKEQYATDLDREVMPGVQGGPLMHIIAAKAVAFKEATKPEFNEYQKRIVENAVTLAKTLADEGQKLVSGGTDTHVMLVSFLGMKFSGKKIENRLEEAKITVNKNTVPFDDRKPFIASGIRIGTPAVTTRGMGPEEMRQIGKMIARVIENRDDETVIAAVRDEVSALCERFPLYPELR
ncbi:MAG: serine hydroxymethyltransferase [Candidatus Zixiibacteriota bacterium]|nr:MAG: serine hydroxymethyltransferase [candidate division Zixibacteria bacterium]